MRDRLVALRSRSQVGTDRRHSSPVTLFADMSFTRILLTLTALGLALPAGAAARGPIVLAPPGNSAVSQYAEVVPTAGGGGKPRAPGEQVGGLSAGQRRSYEGLGVDGRTLVAITDATAPQSAVSGNDAASHHSRRAIVGSGPAAATELSALAADSRRALSRSSAESLGNVILDAATGGSSGGMGIFLPALLVAAGLGAIGLAALRRARNS